jgi:hypothetical protein
MIGPEAVKTYHDDVPLVVAPQAVRLPESNKHPEAPAIRRCCTHNQMSVAAPISRQTDSLRQPRTSVGGDGARQDSSTVSLVRHELDLAECRAIFVGSRAIEQRHLEHIGRRRYEQLVAESGFLVGEDHRDRTGNPLDRQFP